MQNFMVLNTFISQMGRQRCGILVGRSHIQARPGLHCKTLSQDINIVHKCIDFRASTVAWWAKAPAAKPRDLSLTIRNHTVEGEN